MKNTAEQEAIIEASTKSKSLVVNALAGSGKTSTAIACVKANIKRNSIVYLCFNKSVATSMEAKLKKQGIYAAKICTIHSLAFSSCGKALVNKGKEVREIKPHDLKEMGISLPKRSGHRMAACAVAVLERWCGSADLDIGKFLEKPVPKDIADSLKQGGLKQGDIVPLVISLWEHAISDKAGPIPHGVYMKLYHQKIAKEKRKLYDFVIVDEAQDLFPVTEAVIRILGRKSRVMLLGDRYQQIYTWNGSVNSIQNFEEESDVLSLTQSFRCPAPVVEKAERYLRLLGFRGTFRPAPAECRLDYDSPIIISRTNTSLLANVISCGLDPKDIHLVGGIKSYNFDAIRDYLHFLSGERQKIRSPVVAEMNDASEYDAYIESTGDAEMKHAKIVVGALGRKQTWDILIAAQKNLFAESPKSAKLCLSTGHKCKGSEFESVQIDASFQNPWEALQGATTPEGFPAPAVMAEELRLAYVALTRSTRDLFPGTLELSDVDFASLSVYLREGKAVLADLDESGNLAYRKQQKTGGQG